MAGYRVTWVPEAEDELAAIWLAGFDPEVTKASAEVDRRLAADPLTK